MLDDLRKLVVGGSTTALAVVVLFLSTIMQADALQLAVFIVAAVMTGVFGLQWWSLAKPILHRYMHDEEVSDAEGPEAPERSGGDAVGSGGSEKRGAGDRGTPIKQAA